MQRIKYSKSYFMKLKPKFPGKTPKWSAQIKQNLETIFSRGNSQPKCYLYLKLESVAACVACRGDWALQATKGADLEMDTADTSPKTNTAVHPRGTAPDLPRTPSPPLPGPRDARAGQTLNSQPPHSRVHRDRKSSLPRKLPKLRLLW